ncbi:SDR family NAD(P)-dependent oxidoreductase [Pseudomonas iridis]|uniref:SDR family NAD(P)-dependent oxidoreductase n=1 Tax=Pseudomonas iridis TaxID=2710587 RepID=A0ABW8DKN1_9PSED
MGDRCCRGHGPGHCAGFAAEGAKVMLADRDRAKLHAAEEQIRQEGGDVASVIVDVTDYSDCQKMVAAVMQRFNALHIACNNAAFRLLLRPSRSKHFHNGNA